MGGTCVRLRVAGRGVNGTDVSS